MHVEIEVEGGVRWPLLQVTWSQISLQLHISSAVDISVPILPRVVKATQTNDTFNPFTAFPAFPSPRNRTIKAIRVALFTRLLSLDVVVYTVGPAASFNSGNNFPRE